MAAPGVAATGVAPQTVAGGTRPVVLGKVPDAGSTPVDLNFKDADLVDVLHVLGQLGHLNVIADQSVQGKVTLYLQGIGVMDAIEIVTRTAGYSYQIVGSTLVVGSEQRLAQAFGSPNPTVTVTVPLHNLDLATAANIAGIVLGKDGVIEVPTGRALLLKGTADDIAQVRQLLSQFDVAKTASSSSGVQLCELHFLSADAALQLIGAAYPNVQAKSTQAGLLVLRGSPADVAGAAALAARYDVPKVTLSGVLHDGSGAQAVVTIQGTPYVVAPGDVAAGLKVVAIGKNSITLSWDDRQLTVTMGEPA